MALCKCNTGGGNTGLPSCYGVFDVTKQAILVEYTTPSGDINGIDLSTLTNGVFTQADLDARVKDVNPRTRWYATPELKNITDERSDDITEEFEDSSSVFIQEGARSFEGMIIKGDPVLLGNLKSWRCLTVGVFFIDKSGNLIGKQTREGYLDPILLQDDSFSASLIKGTDTTKQKDTIKFDISQLEDDADLRMIEGSKITATLLGVGGLVDVIAETPTGITVDEFVVQLNTPFGGVTSPIPAEGMSVLDFSANELSPTPGVIALTSAVESTTVAGLYTFTMTVSQTSGDVIQISNGATLTKSFDLTAFTVTIP
tara:strand:+ start:1119 stop:2060 length:942 start_codon:yes stop_codon:yes gene_type:complete